MKPGYKTTEFWLTMLVSVAGFIATAVDTTSLGKWGIIASAIATMIYTIGRTQVKKNGR